MKENQTPKKPTPRRPLFGDVATVSRLVTDAAWRGENAPAFAAYKALINNPDNWQGLLSRVDLDGFMRIARHAGCKVWRRGFEWKEKGRNGVATYVLDEYINQ